jgi:hypothetical protein
MNSVNHWLREKEKRKMRIQIPYKRNHNKDREIITNTQKTSSGRVLPWHM